MTKEEKSEEEAHALALKRDAAAGLFTEPFWPASRVLVWIAFRELSRIDDDWRSELRRATWYTSRAPVDANPKRTLLHALQKGKLRAIMDGEAKPLEAWVGATERNFLAMDFMLRRSDVLDLWPEKKTTGVNLEALIRAARAQKGSNLTYKEAEKIANGSGEFFPRTQIREASEAAQGKVKRGRPSRQK